MSIALVGDTQSHRICGCRIGYIKGVSKVLPIRYMPFHTMSNWQGTSGWISKNGNICCQQRWKNLDGTQITGHLKTKCS